MGRIFLIFAVVLAFPLSVPAARSDEHWRRLPPVEMQEEDSHPHEIEPEKEARFHAKKVSEPSVVDAKCSLTGPAKRARILASNMTLQSWPVASTTFNIPPGETLWVNVVGIVQPNTPDVPYFAFQNLDPHDLLWHQCYNN